MNWISQLLLLIAGLSLLGGCVRKTPDETTRLTFTLPAHSFEAKAGVVQQTISASGWNDSANPETLSQVNCYAVLVGWPKSGSETTNDPEIFDGQCTSVAGATMNVMMAKGFISGTAGQETTVSLDVPSGTDRRFVILGLNADSGACVSGMKTINRWAFSTPHILADETVKNLIGGESSTLNLTTKLNTTSDYQIKSCTGLLESSGTTTTTTTTTTSSTSTTTTSTSTTTTTTSTTTTTTTTLPGNNDPVTTNDALMIPVNSSPFTFDALANDTDPDLDTLTVFSVDVPSHGTALTDGALITYTPNAGFVGYDMFNYTIDDGHGNQATGMIGVTVNSPYTWTGAIDGNWTTTGNWCGPVTNPGFTGVCAGGPAPSTSDTAFFNAECVTCSVVVNANVTIGGLILDYSFSGSVTQLGSYTIQTTSGPLKVYSGDFTGGTGNIIIGGDLDVATTGTFTSTSGFLMVQGANFSMAPALFNHNNGTVKLYKNGSLMQVMPGVFPFYNMYIGGSNSSYDFTGMTALVQGNLTLDSTTTRSFFDNGDIDVYGNLNVTSFGLQGDGYINMVSTTSQTITGNSQTSWIPNLEINKTAGILYMMNIVAIAGNYRWVSGPSINTASLSELYITSLNPNNYDFWPGSLNNYSSVTFNSPGSTHDMGGDTLMVTNNLTLNDYASQGLLNNGDVRVKGNIIANALGKMGNSIIRIDGTVSQTISGVPGAFIPALEINSSGGTVGFNGHVVVSGDYIYTAGSISYGSSIMEFSHSNTIANIIPGSTAFNNVVFSGVNHSIDLNGSTMTILGDVTFSDSAGGHIDNGIISARGGVYAIAAGTIGNAHLKIEYGNPGTTLYQSGAGADFLNQITISKTVQATTNINWVSGLHTLTIASGGILNMSGANLTVDGTSTMVINAGGTLNMSGGIKTVPNFINNGTFNP